MKNVIGRGFVVALLVAAGCGSDKTPAASGGGGNGGGGAGTTGSAGTTGIAGTTGSAGTTGGAGTGGGGAGGTGVAGVSGGGTGGGGGTSGGGAGGGAGTTGGGGAGGSGGAAWLTPPAVPPALALPAGATLKIHDHAMGAQVYTCTASGGADAGADGGATTYAWVLKQPDAKLYDSAGVQVGTHGLGPNWTSTDGSIVNGVKVEQANSPDSTAIPWLLLRASSNTGTTGVFSDITYVQRVNTVAGKAPATGCDSTAVGTDLRVDYSADYYFYTGGAGAAWLTPPGNLPALIAVPTGATIKIHDRGIGAQVYTCTASGGSDAGADGGAATYAWVLKQPDAVLLDVTFTQVGTHGLGPNWTSTDGSVVNGTKLQQANSTDASAIPWLLLQASSTSGTGVFTDITYVQRLNTAGGKAPTTGCDTATVGTELRVDYAADYYFFTGGTSTDGGTGG